VVSSTTDEIGKFEGLEFDKRYYTQTAQSAIESIAHVAEEAASNEDEGISRRAVRDGTPDKGTIRFAYDPDTRYLDVTGDGDGMTAEQMRDRLRRVGAEPQKGAKRGFFHRGIREVFLALGGGEVTSIGRSPDGRDVLSKAIFDPEKGIAIAIQNETPTLQQRQDLGLDGTGTRVRIPMHRWATRKPKWFEFGQLESQIGNCVGLRPVLVDPNREVYLEYGAEPPRRLQFAYPDGEDLVVEREMEIGGQKGTFWAGVTEKPITGGGRSKRMRRSGILIRGERAAYEASPGEKLGSHPAMTCVYGELRLDGIERLQREADEESQLIYKTDRSGLNPEHPLVEEIYDFIDATLDPLVAGLDRGEKKKSSPDMRRELQRLARVINDVLNENTVGDIEGTGGEPRSETKKSGGGQTPPMPPEERKREVPNGIAFAHERIFIAAGMSRTVRVWLDPQKIPQGTQVMIETAADEVIHSAALSHGTVPEPGGDGIAELNLTLKAGNTEGRHEVRVSAAGFSASLPVHVRFPRASGFISQIITRDEDWEAGSALYNPSNGVVEIFIGRPEFKDAALRASRDGHKEPWKHPLFRQLMVESVREAALWPAAQRRAEVEWDELPYEERQDGNAFFRYVQSEFQELDYSLRSKLLKAFVVI
jgi:hypothetical protein